MRMIVHVLALWWVVLHDAVFLIPEEVFEEAHLLPIWGSVALLCDAHVLPTQSFASDR
jgi:hypothetical protein